MPSNKHRLYIALYARGGAPTMPGGEDKYHWALFVGPKTEVEDGREWYFEEREVPLEATNMLLVRIMIGKVEGPDRLASILRNVPIKQGESGWNCVIWVKEASKALRADGRSLGTSQLEWRYVQDTAIWYIQKKNDEHRFDGESYINMKQPPTYDLLEGKETIP